MVDWQLAISSNDWTMKKRVSIEQNILVKGTYTSTAENNEQTRVCFIYCSIFLLRGYSSYLENDGDSFTCATVMRQFDYYPWLTNIIYY